MSTPAFCLLENRGFIKVEGEDAAKYLQGLISNDIEKVASDRAIHAALLTPQGKYLHDFFIVQIRDGYLLDCEVDRTADLFRRMRMYKLRSKLDLEDVSADYQTFAIYGDGAAGAVGLSGERGAAKSVKDGVMFIDPRLAALGARAILPTGTDLKSLDLTPGSFDAYDQLRISLGIPDGSRDLEIEKALLLESGYDELGTVDWNKGCYMGQELTARTRYRGLVKKRILPVEIHGVTPPSGTQITADGKDAGELRSTADGQGLALLRLAQIGGDTPLHCGDAVVKPIVPDWVKFQTAKTAP